MALQLQQKTGNFLTGVILAALLGVGIAPSNALRAVSGLTAALGIGAAAARITSVRELEELAYKIRAEAELKAEEFRTKYTLKLGKLQEQLRTIEAEREADAEREALLQQRETELKELQQRLSDLSIANSLLHERWQQVQLDAAAEIEQIKAEYESRVESEIKQGRKALAQRIYQQKFLPKINTFVQKQVNRQNELKAEIELQQQQAEGAIGHYRGLAGTLKEQCEEVVSSLEDWIKEQEQWKEEQIANVMFVIQQIQGQHALEVERLHNQIEHFLKPKRLAATCKASIVANLIADWFLERNVLVDVEDAKSWSDRDELWVKPRNASLKQLKEQADDLWVDFELAQEPEFAIENGCIKIVAYCDEPLDPNITYKALKSADEQIAKHVEASDGTSIKVYRAEDKLRHFARNSERLHFHINGDSGAGKDALMNNLANLICWELSEQGEDVEIILIDVKYPNDSPIIVNGEIIRPRYRGVIDPDSPDETEWNENDSLAGLFALRAEVYRRLRVATEHADRGLPPPKFTKQLWLISELEEAAAVYGDTATGCVKTAWRLGRSLGLAVGSNGQSPNAGAYKGMLNSSFNNTAVVYLRENAYKGVDDRVKTIEQKRPLKRAITWLEKNSEGRDKYDPERFWGVMKLPGEPMFAAFLPEPNAFSGLNGQPEEGEPAEQTIATSATAIDEDTTAEPFSVADIPLFESAEDQLLNAVEQRRQQIAPALPAPAAEPDERLSALTLQAQAIHDAYQSLGLTGHKVTARWAQRRALKSRDLRTMKAAQVLEAFHELANAGYGVVDMASKSWCMGELPAGTEQQLLKGDEKADAVREAVR